MFLACSAIHYIWACLTHVQLGFHLQGMALKIDFFAWKDCLGEILMVNQVKRWVGPSGEESTNLLSSILECLAVGEIWGLMDYWVGLVILQVARKRPRAPLKALPSLTTRKGWGWDNKSRWRLAYPSLFWCIWRWQNWSLLRVGAFRIGGEKTIGRIFLCMFIETHWPFFGHSLYGGLGGCVCLFSYPI